MHIFAQTRFLEVTITKGGIIMKKRIIILASVFLLTGCSGNTPSDDAPDVTNASSLSNLSGESSQGTPGAEQSGNVRTSEAATEEITVGYVTYEAADVGGEPVIADNNSTFYRYAGKRWWVDYSEPAVEFVLRGGKYFPFFDPENEPAEGTGPEEGFAIYPTVESFNEGGWKYIGAIKHGGRDNQRYFYISPDGGTILQFLEDDGYTEVAENEKLFTVGILVASVG